MKLEQIHNCELSEGKIVCIGTDGLGNMYCGYCNEKVDYSQYKHPEYKAFLKRLKEEREEDG